MGVESFSDTSRDLGNAIYEQIDSLADMPKRCSFAVENDRFDIELRQFWSGSVPANAIERFSLSLKAQFMSLLCWMVPKKRFLQMTFPICDCMTNHSALGPTWLGYRCPCFVGLKN